MNLFQHDVKRIHRKQATVPAGGSAASCLTNRHFKLINCRKDRTDMMLACRLVSSPPLFKYQGIRDAPSNLAQNAREWIRLIKKFHLFKTAACSNACKLNHSSLAQDTVHGHDKLLTNSYLLRPSSHVCCVESTVVMTRWKTRTALAGLVMLIGEDEYQTAGHKRNRVPVHCPP
eukprot:364479-Chlamydomonas_euryale.AAC.11